MTLPNRRSYVIFCIVAAGYLTSSISTTIVAVALPKILVDLDTNLAWVGWTLTGAQLSSCIAMPLAGKLSDDWGARRVLLGSMVLFIVSSFLAGVAPNVYVLIFARILQAVAFGGQLPAATSIISDYFGERRETAIGLFTTIFPLGAVIGPSIGGPIVDHLSWRWLFYGCVPFGLASLLTSLPLLPRSERPRRAGRVDAVGIGLFAGSMVAILLAMTAWANDAQSMSHPLTWLPVVAGIAGLGVFLWHEGRTPSPLMELELLLSRPLLATNSYNFLYGGLLIGLTSFLPYYATVAYGMSAGEGGEVLAPRSATMAIAAALSSIFLIRWGYRMPMILGLLLNGLSLLLISQGFHDLSLLSLRVPNFVLLSSIVLLTGIAQGLSAPAANNAALALVPEKLAAVVGLRGMFRSTGGLFATAAIVLVASRFGESQQATGLQAIFLTFGLLSIITVPVVLMIPDTARRRYVDAQNERRRKATPAAD